MKFRVENGSGGFGCLLTAIGISIIIFTLAFIGRGGIEWLMTK